jgi:SAM-dependent methyltransferase
MDFSELDNHFKIFVSDYLKKMVKNPETFLTRIAPTCEMYHGVILPGYNNEKNISYFKYLESGKRTFDIFRQITDFAFPGFKNLNSVLDFASGHGRLTRFLIQYLPAEIVWVSDVDPVAVTWQKNYFGVNGIMSSNDPGEFADNRQYDFIFVGSFFSHMPDGSFQKWLRRLFDMVSEGGVLAFSSHDETYLPADVVMAPEGIIFLPRSECEERIPTSIYGMSYVTEEFVRRSAEDLQPGRTLPFRRFHKALYENQDLYLISKRVDLDFPSFDLVITPMGGFEKFTTKGARMEFSGWGIDFNPGRIITHIEIYINEDLDRRIKPDSTREDILKYFPKAVNVPVGWSFNLPAASLGAGDTLKVRLVSESGASSWCYCMVSGNFTTAEGNVLHWT